jgi:hypothetical protein
LPLEQVNFYQFNYYQTSEVPADRIVGIELYPHFRLAINGGWSYRTAKLADNIPYDLTQYVKDLKSGYHYGLDLSYYFTEQFGLGFKYCNYRSKNEINDVYVTLSEGTKQYGKMSDDISIQFIGPYYSTRLLNANKKNSLIMNFSIGYMGYKDKAVLISDYTIKGNSLGLSMDIGYDIGLTKNFALGFQFSYLIGTLSKYEYFEGTYKETIELEKNNYESLSRFDLSIGLRFTK